MATIPPNVVGLILANRLEVNVDSSELSLIGIFQAKRFSSFPTASVRMTAFTMVNAGRGEGVIQLAIFALDAKEEYDDNRDWIYRQRKWIKFPDDPNFTVTLEIPIKNLVFFKPGEYLFVLTFDGKPITERRLSIRTGHAAS